MLGASPRLRSLGHGRRHAAKGLIKSSPCCTAFAKTLL